MTDPYTEARNASAGMPGHSMSADVTPIPVGMKAWAGGKKPDDWTGEAVKFRSGKIGYAPAPGTIWKLGWDHNYGSGDIIAYTSMSADVGVREAGGEVLDRLRAEIERQCLIGAGMFEVDEGWAQSGLWGINADLDPAGLRAALNAPTESVKAPEGWVLVPREPTEEMIGAASGVDIEVFPTNLAAMVTGTSSKEAWAVWSAMLAASPTPITADDAVAKERERLLAEIARLKRPSLFWIDEDPESGYTDPWEATEAALYSSDDEGVVALREGRELGIRFYARLRSDDEIGVDHDWLHDFDTLSEAQAAINAERARRAAIRSLSPDTEGEGM